jgi:hypothetical protein
MQKQAARNASPGRLDNQALMMRQRNRATRGEIDGG